MICLPKSPVGVTSGQRIRTDLVHYGGRHDLETYWERIEPESGRGNVPDLFDCLFELLYLSIDHQSLSLLSYSNNGLHTRSDIVAFSKKLLERRVHIFFVVDPHTYEPILTSKPVFEDRQQSAGGTSVTRSAFLADLPVSK